MNSIPSDASDQVTDILFQTFNHNDDYGIQETVLNFDNRRVVKL